MRFSATGSFQLFLNRGARIRGAGQCRDVTLEYAQAHQGEFATNPLISGNGIAIQGNTLVHRVRVQGNVVYQNGCGGVDSKNADYLTIRNNVVYQSAYWSRFAAAGFPC